MKVKILKANTGYMFGDLIKWDTTFTAKDTTKGMVKGVQIQGAVLFAAGAEFFNDSEETYVFPTGEYEVVE